ncbi:Inner membrane ABC transporter permease protein yjfF [Pluralibacter gergoviae]|nr:Inner membrane ABC transporter permease protein yjfF [Pluralibacter gergoviae]
MLKRNLPLMITLGVFILGYLYCLTQFPGFASTRVICNILTDKRFPRHYRRGHDVRDPLRRHRPFGRVSDRLYRCLSR